MVASAAQTVAAVKTQVPKSLYLYKKEKNSPELQLITVKAPLASMRSSQREKKMLRDFFTEW